MAKKTLKQQHIEFLQSKGWKIDTRTRVSRYVVMSKPGKDYHYYLGKMGAVRRGRTVTGSVPVKLKLDGATPVPTKAQRERLETSLKKIAEDGAAGRITPEQQDQRHAAALAVEQADRQAEAEQRPDPQPSCGSKAVSQLAEIGLNRSGNSGNGSSSSSTCGVASSTPLVGLLQRSIEKAQGKHPDQSPHVIVEARAGTGKTTTLIEGLKLLKGIGTKLTPSPQQQAVWDAICMSRGKAESVCFVAFNKSIATELQARVPQGCDAMTMHSMGMKVVNRLGRFRVNQYRVQDLISLELEQDVRDIRRDDPILLKATEQLVGLCKMNLTGCLDGTGILKTWDVDWSEILANLSTHYEVELNGSRDKVFDLVPRILERCRDQADGCIDFDDMIWLPVVLDLPMVKYDLLLVDEAQDLNRCQQALAKKAGHRLILCGDPKQAIYGFAGADSESMKRMEEELQCEPCGGTGKASLTGEEVCEICNGSGGCLHLPLTVTRRCGKAIVEEARKYVPDFEAHESNAEGSIGQARFPCSAKGDRKAVEEKDSYVPTVKDGDFILCRVNAPLVSQCFRFLKAGRKANIQGRDIGAGLVSLVNRQKTNSVQELVQRLSDWLFKEQQKEQAKRTPNEVKLISLQDKFDCLMAFTEGMATTADVVRRIEQVFTDSKEVTGIRLSSIHKAKGLEAKRVFFINTKDAPCPHPMAKTAWAREQELNLLYVGITRAIEELIYVS